MPIKQVTSRTSLVEATDPSCYCTTSTATLSVKEYAQGEGVLVNLGVALESMADLLHKNVRLPEMVEYYEKVLCNFARPHVDFVPGRIVTGTRLMHADTCIEEHTSGVWFSLTSVVPIITFLDHLD
jgi:hypothetical protein